jgi:F0F1-type ATP synthase assembly protein I
MWRVLTAVTSVGFLILIAIGIGLLFGLWLDKILHTGPWMAFVWTIIGLAAGLYEAAKILIKAGQ